MFTKIVIFVLLGATLVLASPAHVPEDVYDDGDVIRSDFKERLEAVWAQIKEVAKKLSQDAKVKFEKVKELYFQFKEEAKVELEKLTKTLNADLKEAKEYGKQKYEEVKQKVKEILKTKQTQIQGKIQEYQTKVQEFLNESEKPKY